MEQADIGIIGGTGLYEMEGFTDVREVRVEPRANLLAEARLVGRVTEVHESDARAFWQSFHGET